MKLTETDLVEFASGLMQVPEEINGESALFSTGLLDSVAMMSLINFVEERTGQQVAAHDVTLENFDTPSRILAFVSGNG